MTVAGQSARGAAGAAGAPIFGTVTAFDEARGLGEVTDAAGRRWPFHCTAIADGSRTIDAGAPVAFVAAAGHLGRMEARGLTVVA